MPPTLTPSAPAGTIRHRAVLPTTEPYSFGASLRALGSFAPCTGDQSVAGDRVRKALTVPGHPDRAAVVDLSPAPSAGAGGLALTVFAEHPITPVQASALEAAASRWLGLEDNLAPFLARAWRDPSMAPILSVTEGLHQVRFASWSEAVVYFTLTQRSTQWYAASRKRRIAAAYGPRLSVDGVTHVAFPELATLAGADLTEHAGGEPRAGRLREVIEGASRIDTEWLRVAPYQQARDALLAVRGVGGFTAHALLLRGLGRPDDVPLDMAQFSTAARAVYGPNPPGPAVLREWYGSDIGWWAYLCRTGLGWLEQTVCQTRSAA
jgi:DNA-3-methyladenine glycosylase II